MRIKDLEILLVDALANCKQYNNEPTKEVSKKLRNNLHVIKKVAPQLREHLVKLDKNGY